jgi:group I intron endonuclease
MEAKPMKNLGIIYKATNKINGKCYIGKSKHPIENRKYNHFWCSKKLNENNYFHNAIKKYGDNNFIWEEIWSGDILFIDIMETFKIIINHSHKSEGGYNCTWGGEGVSGYVPTEENKRKQSERMSGKNNPFYGKNHSIETKKKISEKAKKRDISGDKNVSKRPEVRKKLSETNKGEKNGFYGKHHTEESRKKISEATKGENNPMYGKTRPEMYGELNPAKNPDVRKKISEGQKKAWERRKTHEAK